MGNCCSTHWLLILFELMNFFIKIKDELQARVTDLTSIEQVLLIEDKGKTKVALYRHQQVGGDSLVYIMDEQLDPELIELFNDSAVTSIQARTSLVRFLKECII